MNSYTYGPMHSFKTKIIGIAIAILALLVNIISYYIYDLSKQFNLDKLTFEELAWWAFGFGLFIMVFSKEKKEDERVQLIRYKSLRLAFMLLTVQVFMNGFGLSYGIISEIDSIVLLLNFNGVLIIYLVVFYKSYWFDSDFIYNDDTVGENMKKNKSSYIFLGILLTGLILATIFFG